MDDPDLRRTCSHGRSQRIVNTNKEKDGHIWSAAEAMQATSTKRGKERKQNLNRNITPASCASYLDHTIVQSSLRKTSKPHSGPIAGQVNTIAALFCLSSFGEFITSYAKRTPWTARI